MRKRILTATWIIMVLLAVSVFASPEMVLVKARTFQMGDEVGDLWDPCRPVHTVDFTYDYWIGKHQVTFEEYDAFSDATERRKPIDEGWGRESRPVIFVNWWDAIAYCNWLSERNGLSPAYDSNGNLLNRDGQITTDITQVEGYRLPTEAEWENAASGGHQALRAPSRFRYAGSDTIEEVAWHQGNSGNKTSEVGTKGSNELGLYDMSGNVWEWCHDWYGAYSSETKTNPIGPSEGTQRVIRGGAWNHAAHTCRVAFRTSNSPNTGVISLGFRIAKTVF